MTAAQVDTFFQNYAAAFSRFDIDAIGKFWAYPAYIAGRGQRTALNEPEFRSNLVALCAFYKRQGMAEARAQVLELARLTPSSASARTAYTLLDDKGAVIAEWEHVYLLNDTVEGIKVIASLPDGEMDAWDRRGVSMGSS